MIFRKQQLRTKEAESLVAGRIFSGCGVNFDKLKELQNRINPLEKSKGRYTQRELQPKPINLKRRDEEKIMSIRRQLEKQEPTGRVATLKDKLIGFGIILLFTPVSGLIMAAALGNKLWSMLSDEKMVTALSQKNATVFTEIAKDVNNKCEIVAGLVGLALPLTLYFAVVIAKIIKTRFVDPIKNRLRIEKLDGILNQHKQEVKKAAEDKVKDILTGAPPDTFVSVREETVELQLAIVDTLGNTKNEKATNALIAILKSEDERIRNAATGVLEKIGMPVAEILMNSLTDPLKRQHAIEVLDKEGLENATRVLEKEKIASDQKVAETVERLAGLKETYEAARADILSGLDKAELREIAKII